MSKPVANETVTTPPSLEDLLEKSASTPHFKQAVQRFASAHSGCERIRTAPANPPVKVLRVISHLLDTHGHLDVDAIHVDGRSGCSDYRGTVTVETASGQKKSFRFVWDCAWKAEQVGWKTFWGDPDQQKAARHFGYQCFEKFEEA